MVTKRMKMSQRKLTPATNFMFKDSWKQIKRANGKMLEAEPKLERIMTVCKGIEKMLILYRQLYKEKKASAIYSW